VISPSFPLILQSDPAFPENGVMGNFDLEGAENKTSWPEGAFRIEEHIVRFWVRRKMSFLCVARLRAGNAARLDTAA
jgi:hypothetical protein